MADLFSADSNTVFDTLAQDQSAQRAQYAQYDIIRASQYMKDGRQDDAIKAFKQALAMDSTNTTALTYIGKINLSLNRNAEAIKAFKQLVDMDPSAVDSQIQLGNAYLQDKQYGESEKVFIKAASLDRTNPVADYTLGMQYLNTDRVADAEAQFLKVQRISPGDAHVYQALGQTYDKQGRYQEAVGVLKTALTLKPNYPDANYELGMAYNNLGMQTEANLQLTALVNARSSLATDLGFALNKPKMEYIDTQTTSFNTQLGANSQLWLLDPAHLTAAGSSKLLSVSIQFNTDMDSKSITDVANWSISPAAGGGGYYNNTGYVPGSDAHVSTPIAVTYNPSTQQATLMFSVTQNATGNATIDPSHLVFQFKGVDTAGRAMDTSADSIDGYSSTQAF